MTISLAGYALAGKALPSGPDLPVLPGLTRTAATAGPGGGSPAQIRRSGDTLILENGKVSGRFLVKAGKLTQWYYARGKEGWELVATSYSPPGNYPGQANPLLNAGLHPYRYLANDAFHTLPEMLPGGEDQVAAVEMSGSIGNVAIVQRVSLGPEDGHFRFDVCARFREHENKLEYLLSVFSFHHGGAPSFVHTPTLKYAEERWDTPPEEQILGDRSFHTPAVILQEGRLFTALVPDLKLINEARVLSPDARRTIRIPVNKFSVPVVESRYTMPTALDLNVRTGLTPEPVMLYGFIDNIIQHHIRYLHPNNGEMVRTIRSDELRYGFTLFVDADAPEGQGFRRIPAYIWEQYGRDEFRNPHLAMPFAEYFRVVRDVSFSPMADQPPVEGFTDFGSWIEFELQGQQVGGFRTAVPGWTDALWNGSFWNNARDAVGMYGWGMRTGDSLLLDRARRIVRLCLMAPQNAQGLFPLIYRAGPGVWLNASFDVVRGKYGLFSAREGSETFDIPAMSKTCAHLLDYYTRCEPDPAILAFTGRYADWLSEMVGPDGELISYVSTSMEPSDVLRRSAQSATSMWFLAELYKITENSSYLDAARRIAAYLQREILPRQTWIDLEQYFSCGIKSLSFAGDIEQGQPARGNLSTAWAAEGFGALYRATGEQEYLEAGATCIDYLSFTQCSWKPHYVYTANPFGGFSVDNSDHATFLDARQAEYVRPMIWYGRALGRPDLVERGVAAARASVVLINHPRHKMNGIYAYTNIYSFGLGPENIDHEGHPQSAMRTHASWGEGSGVFTGLFEALHALEGGYVDLVHGIVVGVDGLDLSSALLKNRKLKIEAKARLSRLEVPWPHPYPLHLRLEGLPPKGKLDFELNGRLYRNMPVEALRQIRLWVRPDGVIQLRDPISGS